MGNEGHPGSEYMEFLVVLAIKMQLYVWLTI